MVRVHPRWLAARELVRKGKIGELARLRRHVRLRPAAARENVRYAPDMGGGVLLDVGFYPVTMSRFCFDDEPTAVTRARWSATPTPAWTCMTSAMLRFPRGHAIFTCGMQLAPEQRAQLLGSKGHIDMVHAWNPAPDRPSQLVLETSASLEAPAAERIEFVPVNQYTILAQLFARAAATRRPSADPARGFDQEHGRAGRASPLGRQRALGDRLIGRAAPRQPSSRSSRLPMLTTASSTNPMPR